MKLKFGFTMIEVVMVILILGLGLLPIFAIFMSGSGNVERGAEYLNATIMAQSLLDVARSDDFIWEIVPNKVVLPDPDKQLKYPKFHLPVKFVNKYQAKAEITVEEAKGHTSSIDNSIEKNLLQIMVNVTWKEKNIEHHVSLVTYKALIGNKSINSSTRM